MRVKITIGMVRYTGPACSFSFKESVCITDIITPVQKRALTRLKILYAKTKVEPVEGDVGTPPSSSPQRSPASTLPRSGPKLSQRRPPSFVSRGRDGWWGLAKEEADGSANLETAHCAKEATFDDDERGGSEAAGLRDHDRSLGERTIPDSLVETANHCGRDAVQA